MPPYLSHRLTTAYEKLISGAPCHRRNGNFSLQAGGISWNHFEHGFLVLRRAGLKCTSCRGAAAASTHSQPASVVYMVGRSARSSHVCCLNSWPQCLLGCSSVLRLVLRCALRQQETAPGVRASFIEHVLCAPAHFIEDAGLHLGVPVDAGVGK